MLGIFYVMYLKFFYNFGNIQSKEKKYVQFDYIIFNGFDFFYKMERFFD